MKRKTSKYLLCENPINSDEFEEFIYSVRDGKRALIEIKSLQLLDLLGSRNSLRDEFYYVFFSPKDFREPEFYELSVFDNWDIPKHKIPVVLKDAGKWYKNYLIWQEKEIFKLGVEKIGLDETGDDDEALNDTSLKDYNEKIKGLKIVFSKDKEKWLVIFRGKIKVFESKADANQWLITDMNVSEDQIENGIINEIK